MNSRFKLTILSLLLFACILCGGCTNQAVENEMSLKDIIAIVINAPNDDFSEVEKLINAIANKTNDDVLSVQENLTIKIDERLSEYFTPNSYDSFAIKSYLLKYQAVCYVQNVQLYVTDVKVSIDNNDKYKFTVYGYFENSDGKKTEVQTDGFATFEKDKITQLDINETILHAIDPNHQSSW